MDADQIATNFSDVCRELVLCEARLTHAKRVRRMLDAATELSRAETRRLTSQQKAIAKNKNNSTNSVAAPQPPTTVTTTTSPHLLGPLFDLSRLDCAVERFHAAAGRLEQYRVQRIRAELAQICSMSDSSNNLNESLYDSTASSISHMFKEQQRRREAELRSGRARLASLETARREMVARGGGGSVNHHSTNY
eukprot:PhM_4_TR2490/c0_g1_i1/m.89725